jgi:hypothetical protein
VPGLEIAAGIRVVAGPEALEAARWHGDDVDVLRIAPDEALALGATGADVDGDADAIVEPEVGFAVALLTASEAGDLGAHADWPIPETPGTLAQGKIAGVPAKLLVGEPTLLLLAAAVVGQA